MRTNEKFHWPSFLKNVAIIAIPVALQNLLTTTASMVDTLMIAPLGENSVAAIGLCAQFSFLMFSGYWGFVGGGMLFFSQYYGAGDDEGVCRSYGVTLSCMMTVGILFGLAAALFPELIMRVYTDKINLQNIGVQYLRIIGCAYPLQVLSVAVSALLRSSERVKIPLYASITSVLINIIFNYILIHGKLGFPAMGVSGAALASLIAAVTNVCMIFLLSYLGKHPHLFRFREHFKWNRSFLKEYFTKCFPILCNELFIGVGYMVINIVLGRQAEEAIAATAVFRTLEGMVIGFFAGFSNASSVLVGKCVGSGQLRMAYERAKRLVYLCAGFIFAICLLLLALHKPILTAMSLSGESLRYGTGMLMIYCFAATIRLSNWTKNDTYRAAGDAAFGSLLEITFMYLMLLPAVYLSGMVFKAPFLVIFACCYIDEPVRFILMHIHLYSGKWIKPVTPEGMQALPEFMKSLKK